MFASLRSLANFLPECLTKGAERKFLKGFRPKVRLRGGITAVLYTDIKPPLYAPGVSTDLKYPSRKGTDYH
jgi:hypothetical protein